MRLAGLFSHLGLGVIVAGLVLAAHPRAHRVHVASHRAPHSHAPIVAKVQAVRTPADRAEAAKPDVAQPEIDAVDYLSARSEADKKADVPTLNDTQKVIEPVHPAPQAQSPTQEAAASADPSVTIKEAGPSALTTTTPSAEVVVPSVTLPPDALLTAADAPSGERPQSIGKPASVASDPEAAPVAPLPGAAALTPAKALFSSVSVPTKASPRAIGGYAKGCLAGAQALPIDGPAWQVMRLSRNRNWGHPKMVALVEKIATDAKEKDGWSGLLVGDLSQPRGGPMSNGHASHQVGLDADIWLTPMPDHVLSATEREKMVARSVLSEDGLMVGRDKWTEAHTNLIKRAASYPEVERVLVHPAIKQVLCYAAKDDRGWLAKVRPYWGHDEHIHIRIGCPAGSGECHPQPAVSGDDGCGKEVDDWLKRVDNVKPDTSPLPMPSAVVTVKTVESAKTGTAAREAAKADTTKSDVGKGDTAKSDAAKAVIATKDTTNKDTTNKDTTNKDTTNKDTTNKDTATKGTGKKDTANKDTPKVAAAKPKSQVTLLDLPLTCRAVLASDNPAVAKDILAAARVEAGKVAVATASATPTADKAKKAVVQTASKLGGPKAGANAGKAADVAKSSTADAKK